jgi:YegS/Rv2252/BmrU family lipid kinase
MACAPRIIRAMRTCVIFNPAARGNKARHFRQHLGDMAGQSAFKATTAPGDARRLAAEAVAESFELIVAAGGDGTINEVLNGLGDTPDGFARVRFGVLPLGTVNVFARELKIPLRVARAWEILQNGRELKIDLGCAEFSANGVRKKQFFAQLAGAGLDARAIELVDWSHKKKIGPLAYVIAGLKALREQKPKIVVARASRPCGPNSVETHGQDARAAIISGELILIGNGKFYGGSYEILPGADLRDGLLEVCIFPRVDFPTLLRCAPSFLARQKLPEKVVRRFRA